MRAVADRGTPVRPPYGCPLARAAPCGPNVATRRQDRPPGPSGRVPRRATGLDSCRGGPAQHACRGISWLLLPRRALLGARVQRSNPLQSRGNFPAGPPQPIPHQAAPLGSDADRVRSACETRPLRPLPLDPPRQPRDIFLAAPGRSATIARRATGRRESDLRRHSSYCAKAPLPPTRAECLSRACCHTQRTQRPWLGFSRTIRAGCPPRRVRHVALSASHVHQLTIRLEALRAARSQSRCSTHSPSARVRLICHAQAPRCGGATSCVHTLDKARS